MNLRTEMAGAWRSLRYDMGKRDVQADPPADDAPDVTSTGMSTFGGAPEPTHHTRRSEPLAENRDPVRPPRRAAAVAAFGALAVTGAAGSYFAVVNGLGSVLAGESATLGPYPLAAAGPTGAADDADTLAANAGLGRGTAPRPATGTTTTPAGIGAVRVPPEKLALPAPRQPAAPRTGPARPGAPASEDCDCLTPPVPTPTAPGSASPSASGSVSASPSASDSESPSGEPSSSSPTADPSGSGSEQPAGRSDRWRRSH
jgi:hypothetical protein